MIHMYNEKKFLIYYNVPICKEGSPDNWFILPYIHVNLNEDRFSKLKKSK